MIRRIGREVAAEGLAGEEAIEAAQKAEDQDKSDRLVANYHLLVALVSQVNNASEGQSSGDVTAPAELLKLSQVTLDQIAPLLGRSSNWVAGALEAIADVMACIGVTVGSTTGRVPRLVQLLQRCAKEIADWGRTESLDRAAYADMIYSVANFTWVLAEATLSHARALTGNMVTLLRTWASAPDTVADLAGRPDWLLDGWEQICLLWDLAKDDAARRASLVEITQLLPILPREASEWSNLASKTDISSRLRRVIPLNEDWRTGTKVFELIARNERLRAGAC